MRNWDITALISSLNGRLFPFNSESDMVRYLMSTSQSSSVVAFGNRLFGTIP